MIIEFIVCFIAGIGAGLVVLGGAVLVVQILTGA